MKFNNYTIPISSIIIAHSLWGTGNIIAKIGLKNANPFLFAMVRELSVSLLLMIVVLVTNNYK